MPGAFTLAAGHHVVKAVLTDLLQVLCRGHPPIHHDRRGRAGACLEPIQHLAQRGPLGAIAIEHLMGFGEPVSVNHQPHYHLLAVRAMVLRVAPFGLAVGQTLALEVAGGQIVEIDRAVQVEQLLFPFGQCGLDLRPFGMQAVQMSIERVVVHPGEIDPQDVRQGGARKPVRHRMFGARGDQAVQGHQLGQAAGRLREPRPESASSIPRRSQNWCPTWTGPASRACSTVTRPGRTATGSSSAGGGTPGSLGAGGVSSSAGRRWRRRTSAAEESVSGSWLCPVPEAQRLAPVAFQAGCRGFESRLPLQTP